MATYTLKNISVGGDIYQISAGPEYVTVRLAYDLEDTSTTFSGTLAEIMANNVGTWSITSINKNGVSYDPTTTMLSTLTGRKQYSGDWKIVDANGSNGGEFAGLQINYQYFTLAIPGKTSTADFTGMVKLQIDELTNTVYQKGILLPGGGGGGGGSSITTYIAQDQYGQPLNVNQFSSGVSGVKLMNTDDGTFATDSDIVTAFGAGEIVINIGDQWSTDKLHVKVDAVVEGPAVRFCGTYYTSSAKTFVFNYQGSSAWQISS